MDSAYLPQEIIKLRDANICSISCGQFFCLALTKSGTLYSWGENTAYSLGTIGDDIEDQYEPMLVEFFRNIKLVSIAAGDLHALAVTGISKFVT